MEQPSLPSALYHASTAITLHPTSPHAYRHRALVWAAQSCHVLALADGEQAERLWREDTLDTLPPTHRRDRSLEELQPLLDVWRGRAGDEAAQREALTALLTPPPTQAVVPLQEHEAEVRALQTTVAQLQLRRTAARRPSTPPPDYFTDSMPPTPRTQAKQERILCVVCMDQPRSQLFEPCKHLLCCEGCGSLVRGVPVLQGGHQEEERAHLHVRGEGTAAAARAVRQHSRSLLPSAAFFFVIHR